MSAYDAMHFKTMKRYAVQKFNSNSLKRFLQNNNY